MRTQFPAAPRPSLLRIAPALFLFASAGACSADDPRCKDPMTPIFEIQGHGEEAAITGPVTTLGIVIGDFEGPSPNLRGFFLQDLAGDDDPETSDGIFVFHGDADSVALGQRVRVTGTAGEFQGQTQIAARAIVDCGGGVPPPPVELLLPASSSAALERLEGMRVQLSQTLHVTANRLLGHTGEIVLSSARRLPQPTDVAAPGADGDAVRAANELDRIVLDDASNQRNPDPIRFGRGGAPLAVADPLRAGDTVTGVVGVFGFGWGGSPMSPNTYRVRPIGALGGVLPPFVAGAPRPTEPPAVGGTLQVAAANVLNYFNSFGARSCRGGVGGSRVACRGASNAAEFERQAAKTVALLLGLDADILAVTELENDGYGADSAIADLRRRLDAVSGRDVWAFVDADAGTGKTNALGRDAIKVGILYRPSAVEPVGAPAVLSAGAFGRFRTATGTTGRNRPALAQTFEERESGERFTLAVLHLKSKASACDDNRSPVGPDPDTGDGQGNCNHTRSAASRELAAWLAGDPTRSGDPDQLIVGDLNSYAREDPVLALRNAGFVDLLARAGEAASYSFVFDGRWGRLDHALASASLAAQTTGAATWHINADEPPVLDYNLEWKSASQRTSLYAPDAFRSSDHDPLRVGLALSGSSPPVPEAK